MRPGRRCGRARRSPSPPFSRPAATFAPVAQGAPGEEGVPPGAGPALPADGEPGDVAEEGPRVADPLAPWNRAMFQFNDKLYFWVLKPVSRAYRAAVPRIARRGVENFFHNLGTPLRLASDLLQLKGGAAGRELGEFMLNSTWGLLGFGNLFAGDPQAATPEADIGLALAHHGVGNGIYIVWPFLGPSTLRDSVGLVGDFLLDPVTYVQPFEASLAVRGYDKVNSTSFRIGDYESLKDAAIDPYLATRDAYLQYRARKAGE